MELGYSLFFYLKKPKNYTSENIPVYMRFTVGGIQKECATTRTADPRKWCSKTSRESGKIESSKSLNYHLDDLQQKVHDAHAVMVKEGKPTTAVGLRDKFLGRDISQKIPQLLEIFQLHNKQMKEWIGKEFEENTLKEVTIPACFTWPALSKKTYQADNLAITI